MCLFCEPSFCSQQEIGKGISTAIKKKKKTSGKYAVFKTIFTELFGCATANQYVTPTRTEKTTASEPVASLFHTYLQTAKCFNTDILSYYILAQLFEDI